MCGYKDGTLTLIFISRGGVRTHVPPLFPLNVSLHSS